eukprot:gb/GECH01014849.1/.p1 GENE.gb/GECH01014849.1/~~gb/GECH01014849.1/.p1  ORF type:complete len:622 (+),score=144.64 gb/GECH01014849.1/:1-1866(+)
MATVDEEPPFSDVVLDSKERVLPSYEEYFKRQQHCDVTLKLKDGSQLPAHKVFLSNKSRYFSTVFHEFENGSKDLYELDFEDEHCTLPAIFEHAYGSNITLNEQTAIYLLDTAQEFLFDELGLEITEFLKENINSENISFYLTQAAACKRNGCTLFLAKTISEQWKELEESGVLKTIGSVPLKAMIQLIKGWSRHPDHYPNLWKVLSTYLKANHHLPKEEKNEILSNVMVAKFPFGVLNRVQKQLGIEWVIDAYRTRLLTTEMLLLNMSSLPSAEDRRMALSDLVEYISTAGSFRNLFLLAAQSCDPATLRMLYTCNPKDRSNEYGETPLHLAAYGGNLAVVEYILDNRKESIDDKDNDGNTPFLEACWRGHLKTAQYLENNGADIFAIDANANNAIHYAARNKNPNVLNYLLNKMKNRLNEKNNFGESPIMHAVCGPEETIEPLFKALQLNEKSDLGHDAPAYPPNESWIRLMECLTMLVQNGANISETTPAGTTLLHLGAMWGKTELLEWLQEAGSQVFKQDQNGNTLLHYGASNQREKTLHYMLIDQGFDANGTNKTGTSALHLAVYIGNTIAVQKFVAEGGDPDKKDGQGRSAVDIAKSHQEKRDELLKSLNRFSES